ncbi:MAG: YdcF family protein [Nevskia sp.]
MNFLLSKLVGGLLAPGTLLLLALALAFALQRRRPRLSRGLLGGALLFVAALSLLPLGRWLIWPLETRFPAPSALKLDHVDGILVLGGAVNALDTQLMHGEVNLNDAAERMTAFVALARRYPEARLVWSGGSGYALGAAATQSESVPAQALFESLGVEASRVVYERASRNTWENAVFSKRLVEPRPGETWLLVTSAWHMPRSVGIFRRIGWPVLPYPVDYLEVDPAAWGRFEASRELYAITVAIKEWLGLASYRLMDRTDALLPGADPSTQEGTHP